MNAKLANNSHPCLWMNLGAGTLAALALPPMDGSEPSAVQLLGVLKLRRPHIFDLDSISALKRATAGEGGASSGGYLLSALALDPHSLIILSTAPSLLSPIGDGQAMQLCVWIPPDAFPSYKGDCFDIEYVLVRKRLTDGHLEMAMAAMDGTEMLPRIQYSRDCPCVLRAHPERFLDIIHGQLRDGACIDKDLLELMRKSHSKPMLPSTSTFSLKNDDREEIVVVSCSKQNAQITDVALVFKQPVNSLRVELFRIEAIDDLFSATEYLESSKLVYRREFGEVGMAVRINLDDLPNNLYSFSCPMFRVKFSLSMSLSDGKSCSLDFG